MSFLDLLALWKAKLTGKYSVNCDTGQHSQFLRCVFIIWIALVACVLFSTVHFQMLCQIVCTQRRKVTLVAFVWLFSSVRFQMFLQITCQRWDKITLVAFVGLLSTVRFQMSPQIACMRGCIVTLVTFVWLFSTVHFQMLPQMACLRRCKVTLVTFVWLFSIILPDFQICILQTRFIKILLHYHRVLCFPSIAVSN